MSADPFNLDVLKSSCGYIDTFIDGKTNVSINSILTEHQKELLPLVDGNKSGLLKYTMLSIWYNTARKVPFVAAYNIDGTLEKKKIPRKTFRPDPRFKFSEQLNESFYDLITDFTEFEIGHMASHNEMSWGVNGTTQAHQTFYFSNSVPQVEKLNSGLWSKLESYVIAETDDTENNRIAVFTGPMLKNTDPYYVKDATFQVPLFFYKIVVFSFEGKLYSTAFVMSQLKRAQELQLIPDTLENFDKGLFEKTPTPFSDYRHREVFQVNIDLIEHYCDMQFKWTNVKRIKIPNDQQKLKKISQTGGSTKNLKTNVEGFKNEFKLTNMVLPSRKFFK